MSSIEEGLAICPSCGKNFDAEIAPHHLQPGVMLHNRYLVGSAIGEGGFGITYIGRDTLLDLKVAIKEYYPSGYANRSNMASSTVMSGTRTDIIEYFDKGKHKFINEARTLAKFSNETGIVSVRDFFEENNTAYIIMEYLEGTTLKSYIEQNGTITPEATVELILPVMESLKKVHSQGLIHRDISPDNIMLTEDNKVKLLDFGAARNVSSSGYADKSLSVMLKPGYAPEEQYRSRGQQGPWTDIYALCATMYKCITGITPDDAAQRMFEDEVKAPSDLGIEIAPNVEAAILKGMSVHQKDRYQTIDDLIAALKGKDEAAAILAGTGVAAGLTTGIGTAAAKNSEAEDPHTVMMENEDPHTVMMDKEDPHTVLMDKEDPHTMMMSEDPKTVLMNNQQDDKKEKKKKGFIVPVIISTVAIGAIIAVVLMFLNKKQGNNDVVIYVPTDRGITEKTDNPAITAEVIPTNYGTEIPVQTPGKNAGTEIPITATSTIDLTTQAPTNTSTQRLTATPTQRLTATPTQRPTATPTQRPTATPTQRPTATPTNRPTATPTQRPTATPTERPTATPTPQPNEVRVSKIYSDGGLTLFVGEPKYKPYRIVPANASNKNVTWRSQNTSIATVDEYGLITGKAPGETEITITTEDGNKTASFRVEVLEQTRDYVKVTFRDELTIDGVQCANFGNNTLYTEVYFSKNDIGKELRIWGWVGTDRDNYNLSSIVYSKNGYFDVEQINRIEPEAAVINCAYGYNASYAERFEIYVPIAEDYGDRFIIRVYTALPGVYSLMDLWYIHMICYDW